MLNLKLKVVVDGGDPVAYFSRAEEAERLANRLIERAVRDDPERADLHRRSIKVEIFKLTVLSKAENSHRWEEK